MCSSFSKNKMMLYSYGLCRHAIRCELVFLLDYRLATRPSSVSIFISRVLLIRYSFSLRLLPLTQFEKKSSGETHAQLSSKDEIHSNSWHRLRIPSSLNDDLIWKVQIEFQNFRN